MRAVGIDVGVRFQDAVLLVDGRHCEPPRRLAAAAAGYPVSTDPDDVRARSLEVFPHATAVVLRGARPPLGCTRRTRSKREWRTCVLTDAGVDVSPLRSVHDVDAALAAITAARALAGEATAVGDPDEGVVVVPVRALRDRYEREVIAG